MPVLTNFQQQCCPPHHHQEPQDMTVHPTSKNQSRRYFQLVSMYDLRALVLDPADPSPQRSLDFTFHRVNLVLGNPFLSFHFRISQPPPGLWRTAQTPPRRNRCHIGWVWPSREDLVAIAKPKTLPAHNLQPSVTPLTRPVPVPVHVD